MRWSTILPLSLVPSLLLFLSPLSINHTSPLCQFSKTFSRQPTLLYCSQPGSPLVMTSSVPEGKEILSLFSFLSLFLCLLLSLTHSLSLFLSLALSFCLSLPISVPPFVTLSTKSPWPSSTSDSVMYVCVYMYTQHPSTNHFHPVSPQQSTQCTTKRPGLYTGQGRIKLTDQFWIWDGAQVQLRHQVWTWDGAGNS